MMMKGSLKGSSLQALKYAHALGVKLTPRPSWFASLKGRAAEGDPGRKTTASGIPTVQMWASKYCAGTCSFMCGTDGSRGRPEQTKLVTYAGAQSITALNDRTLVMSNSATEAVSQINVNLAFKCSDTMTKLGRVYRAFSTWRKEKDDGSLMQSPALGQRYVVEVKKPPSHWSLTLLRKKQKVQSKGSTAFLIKNLFCAQELDKSGKPMNEESCCVEKELMPISAAKDSAMVSALKAW
jgi:hypothetical protein